MCRSLFKYVVYLYVKRPVPSLAPPFLYDRSRFTYAVPYTCRSLLKYVVYIYTKKPKYMPKDLYSLVRHHLSVIGPVSHMCRSLFRFVGLFSDL